MFWMSFFVALAISVVGELIRPKQSPPNAEASALDDFDMPTAESGRILTVFCGKVKITGANVTYYGGLSTKALTKKVKTGLEDAGNARKNGNVPGYKRERNHQRVKRKSERGP